MRITHLSMNDISGGAARAVFRLNEGLRRLGHESSMLVQNKLSRDSSVTYFAPPLDLVTRFRRVTHRYFLRQAHKFHYSRRPANATFFSDDRSEHGADVLRRLPPTDILHLHWIAGFLDYADFFSSLPSGLPVVWTLHDMNPFTGGCHHAADCSKFRNSCGVCPQLGSVRQKDFSTDIWNRKRLAYDRLTSVKFSVVTPSRWLAGEVRQSALLGHFPVSVIPYGLDTECFKPRDCVTAREVFGIPINAKVLLFVSAYLDDKYKGLARLLEAIDILQSVPDLFLLVIGNGQALGQLPVSSKSLDFFTDEKLLSLVYSAADIFALPSASDNFPNTALEALACGLPVVAFDVGGIPDIVRHNSTGVLVESSNSQALAEAIRRLLDNSNSRSEMSRNCRRVAEQEYGLELQAKRYADLYASLLSPHPIEAAVAAHS